MVSAVDTYCCSGRFDASSWIGEGWIGYICIGEGRFIRGRFREIDSKANTCSFYPDDATEIAGLRPNVSYPYLDGYWGERAELVLDERRNWQRRAFEPSDAVRYQAPGGASMVTKSSAEAPPGGETVDGGWDHEHCDICWETINVYDQPAGYFSPPRTWICDRCYTSYVIPRSLAFIRTA
jgi:hypothetical protein